MSARYARDYTTDCGEMIGRKNRAEAFLREDGESRAEARRTRRGNGDAGCGMKFDLVCLSDTFFGICKPWAFRLAALCPRL